MPIRCVALGLLLLAGKGAEASLVKLTVSAKARRCEKALEQAACAGHGVDATRGQTAEEAQKGEMQKEGMFGFRKWVKSFFNGSEPQSFNAMAAAA